ncbi:stage II sporulation protein E [Phosphitispora sp. TUW77]|uniref:stage II sporulation protein E n=1 Tax=Phosphitispora sp. TUW77 TaxID=3152361 RepID=UPI003AB4F273
MGEKSGVYAYHRLSGRRPKSRIVLPAFSGQAAKQLLRQIFTMDTGFLMLLSFFVGRAMITGGLIPFPAALLAAGMTVLGDKGFLILIASAAGLATISSGHILTSTLITLVLLFLILGRTQAQFRQKWYGVPVLVAGLIIGVKVGVYSYFAPELYNYIVAIFEAILAGCATFLLIKTLPVLRKAGHTATLKKEELIGGAVLVVAVLTGMSELNFQGLQVKNVISRSLVLFAAYTGGCGFGAAMGTLAGIVPSITAEVAPGMVAVYSFSGLLAGMFRGFGRIGICIGFILGNVILSIYLTDYSQLVTAFAEILLAVVLFMAIPAKWLLALRAMVKNSLFNFNSKSISEKRVKEIVAGKVRDYSRIFRELSIAFDEVSCDVRVYEENNLQTLFSGVASKVCKGCSLYRICWDAEFYKTYRNIMDMISYIEINGRLTEEHVSPDVQKRCARLKELAVTVNCLYETYRQAQVWQRKLTEGRDILARQLDGIATMMQNLANEVKIDIRMREDIEVILRTELAKAGYSILDLSVIGEVSDQLEVSITLPSCGGKAVCIKKIKPIVSRILSQQLTVLNSNYCTKKTSEPVCEFKLVPMRAFTVEIGVASVAKDSSMVSGDNYADFDLKDGKHALVISDGMGIGPKASIESKAAIALVEKLMEAGFDHSVAVKTANSILILGSPTETITTLDLASINLMNGVVEFIKIGAVPSFIKYGSQVAMVKSANLPIGILNHIEIDTIQQQMSHDDVLVMVSDGLLGSGGDQEGETWIMDALQNIMTTDPQNIADLLLNKASLRSGGIVNDDITVLVARLVSAHD